MFPNDFDADEYRRRMLLQLPGQEVAMAPDVQEGVYGTPQENNTLGYPSGVNTAQTPEQPPSALQRYSQVLGQMPQQTDYQPSFMRRLGSAIVGIGQGPKEQAAYQQKPYTQALGAWQQQLGGAQEQANIEDKMTSRKVAQQRADAYQAAQTQNAATRARAADTMDKYRQSQEANMPWQAHTEEEYTRTHPHNPPRDFAGELAARLKNQTDSNNARIASEEKRATELRKNQRDLEGMRESGANSRNNARIAAAQTKTPTPPSATQQASAEQQAVSEWIRQHPEHKEFVDTTTSPAGITRHQIKDAGMLPKSHWYNGVTPAQEGLARDEYNKFLRGVEQKKKAMLSRKPGESPFNTVEQEEEE